MARYFNVSRSGYYFTINTTFSKRKEQEEMLIDNIRTLQKEHKNCLTAKPMTIKLKRKLQIPIGHNRIRRIMKENGLEAERKIKKYRQTEPKTLDMPYINLLNRRFTPGLLDYAWCADTTYIETTEGWNYLCAILEIGNKEIIGWSFSDRIDTDAALCALNNALVTRNYPENVIFHTDRGSQFCSERFQNELEDNKFLISLSRKGNCWDNACIESFFKTLKYEWLYRFPVCSPEETRRLLFEFIEMYYNTIRPHSSLGYLSPREYINSENFIKIRA